MSFYSAKIVAEHIWYRPLQFESQWLSVMVVILSQSGVEQFTIGNEC